MALALLLIMGLGGFPEDGHLHRVELERGFYLLFQPQDVTPATPVPLLFILHGTDTRAVDILDFWKDLDYSVPHTLVAPQAGGAGWGADDLPFLADVIADVQDNVPHDSRRVLLTGHSAGGAMALHLYFAGAFPATAIAVTANYVPPSLTADDILKRRPVPVFYAVGQGDENRPRMDRGLALLRDNGVRVTVRRPAIGHVLDKATGQAALDWFTRQGLARVDAALAQAEEVCTSHAAPGESVAALEDIIRYQRYHPAGQVARATGLLKRLQAEGRLAVARADREWAEGRYLLARQTLLDVEERYRPSTMAGEARARRNQLEDRPEVKAVLRSQRAAGEVR